MTDEMKPVAEWPDAQIERHINMLQRGIDERRKRQAALRQVLEERL